MSVRTITENETTALYDSTSGVAFGPVFTGIDSEDQARHFLNCWLNNDAREYDARELEDHYARWVIANLDPEHGELTADAHRQLMSLT